MTDDRLQEFWNSQLEFMELLRAKRKFPEFPVDISSKNGQKLLKDIIHDCQDELFESNQCLKNAKQHRATEISEFNRDEYIEELVDSQKFLFEILILSGVSLEEFCDAFVKKTEKNKRRIEEGY